MDRGILFSAPMVRALLDGRKTQTRRVLKPRPPLGLRHTPGDRLWVRESIGRRPASFLGIEATNGVEEAFYVADGEDVLGPHDFNICPWWRQKQTLPSIHMPRWASRLTLVVTDVRVRRVQEISEEDAKAEGALSADFATGRECILGPDQGSYRLHFQDIWDSLNAPRGYGWDANPWVAAITFTVHKVNVDALAGEPK